MPYEKTFNQIISENSGSLYGYLLWGDDNFGENMWDFQF